MIHVIDDKVKSFKSELYQLEVENGLIVNPKPTKRASNKYDVLEMFKIELNH
jgi:hypothetical protein